MPQSSRVFHPFFREMVGWIFIKIVDEWSINSMIFTLKIEAEYVNTSMKPRQQNRLLRWKSPHLFWIWPKQISGQQFFGLVYYQTTHDLVALQPEDKKLQEGRPLEDLPSWLLPRLVQTGVFQEEEINQVRMTGMTLGIFFWGDIIRI